MKHTYYVNWRYGSNLGGPWKAGDEVRLDEATAIAVNNDSPGVLTRLEPVTIVVEVEAEVEVDSPPPAPLGESTADRQLKAAPRQRGRRVEQHMPAEPQQPGTVELIDTTVYKAVRDKE